MELYQGVILGILQGLTEFLPVSSSGHLVLGQIFFGMSESQLVFDISVHVGTLMAVMVVYASDIMAIMKSVFRFLLNAVTLKPIVPMLKQDSTLQMGLYILAGTIPTAFIGLALKKFEHILFTSVPLVGVMLLATGTILWVSRRFYLVEDKQTGLEIKQAILIGITQGLAVIPGISRSGSTIAAGMVLGLDRHMAAKFSFLLSIPAILGAQILSVKHMMDNHLVIDSVTLYATLVSFITGFLALKLLLKLVHSGRFHLFAPYCWLMGALVLLSTII